MPPRAALKCRKAVMLRMEKINRCYRSFAQACVVVLLAVCSVLRN